MYSLSFSRILFAVLIFFALITCIFPQEEIVLKSPDNNIVYTFKCLNSKAEYKISYNDKELINYSSLTLAFEKESNWGNKFKLGKPIFKDGEDSYTLVVGKAKNVHDIYKQVEIPLLEEGNLTRRINFVVRAFNDGLAFRYEFPKQKNWSSFNLTDENTAFNLNSNPTFLTMFLPNFTTPHEGMYSKILYKEIKNDTLMDMPTLIEYPDNIYMAITEAELVNYAGMYLTKKNGVLVSQLSPLPGQTEMKVKEKLPARTPWRVLLISDRVGDLIESNIITSLNEPCKIKDVSWIKPGKTDFHWWNGDVCPDTTFGPGINFDFNKYYIDFCSLNYIEYHTMIGYGGIPWYQNYDGLSYQPGPHSDPTKPRPGLDMKKICEYAKSKNVGIRVWVHWKALYPKLDETFRLYEKWGITGVMVDFLNRDDQEMVNIQNRIVREAARYHLTVNFHGAYKPTGLSRTYPNEFNREGAKNYEYDKFGKIITADHDINILFTRGLAGATDYHLGGFRAVPVSKYKQQYVKPFVVVTRCHMLAMYVILQNNLQMVCDYPQAYLGQPGFEFIKEVPTAWDKTKVIGAEVGQWISIAREKNNDWYVGTITNNEARKLGLSLRFLPDGKYKAEIYSDASDDDINPNHLIEKTIVVTNKDTINTNLAGGGGQVIRIFPLQ